MTTTSDIALPTPSRVGQATAVEQSRAVAQVHAMIVVAQQNPRSITRAIGDMRESCKRMELADRAFFRYKRGSTMVSDASIHLARELARVWGNIEYGLSELRRDDEYGQSELLAFAWDVQTNTRNASVIINPHRQYTGGRDLTELRDIYENNANVGARRVRQAIFAVLPPWFVEEAKKLCAETIANGDGLTQPQRIANAIEVYGNLGITVAQLERKIGRASGKWDEQDVATLRVIRQSLLRGEITKEEEFPADAPVTADEIKAQGKQAKGPKPSQDGANQNVSAGQGPGQDAKPVTAQDVNAAFKALGFGVKDKDDVLAAAAAFCDRDHPVKALADLSAEELAGVMHRLSGCETRDDVTQLHAQVIESRGDQAAQDAAGRAPQAGDTDG